MKFLQIEPLMEDLSLITTYVKYRKIKIIMKYLILLFSFILFISLGSSTILHVGTVEAQSLDKLQKLKFGDSFICQTAFSPDGKYFTATASRSNQLRIWDTKTWTVVSNLTHPYEPCGQVFSPDSKLLVSSTSELANGGLRNQKLWFWNVETGKNIAVLERGDVKPRFPQWSFHQMVS